MGLPEGSLAIAVLVVVAVPGLLYAAVRRWARGESADDRDLGLSIAGGTVFAVTLTSVYLLTLGDVLYFGLAAGADADTIAITQPRRVAFTVLGLYIAVPAALAILLNLRHLEWTHTTRLRWLPLPRSKHGYTSAPSAWDHAVRRNQQSWVKIHRANGEWVGGWATKGSFASAYPEPRAIYIDQQWSMTDDGNYTGPIPGTGVHLTIADEDLVIWTKPVTTPIHREEP